MNLAFFSISLRRHCLCSCVFWNCFGTPFAFSLFFVATTNNMADRATMPRRLSSSKALEYLNSMILTEEEHSDDSSYSTEDVPHHFSSESEDDETDLVVRNVDEPGPSNSRLRRRIDNTVDVLVASGGGDSDDSNVTGNVNETGDNSRASASTSSDWQRVESDAGVHLKSFRFRPTKTPGVNVPLSKDSTPLDCFLALFTNEVKNKLIKSINDFAALKIQKNTPAKRYSVYAKWTPITDHELYKLMAVIIQIGLDPKPQIKDYWDKSDKGYSPWYSQMFTRNRL